MTVRARLFSRRCWLASAEVFVATALATSPRAARSQTARTLGLGYSPTCPGNTPTSTARARC